MSEEQHPPEVEQENPQTESEAADRIDYQSAYKALLRSYVRRISSPE